MSKSTVVPLNQEKHANVRLIESNDFSRFKNQHLIPVIAQDVFALAAEFPIVFVKNSESDEFVMVALMGLKDNQNLFCQDTEWKSHVAPSSFTSAPLSVALIEKGSDQVVVCIDEDSPLVSQTQGESLFSEDGEKTEYLQKRIESVMRIAEQTVQTQNLCKLFATKNLLSSHQLTIKHREDAPQYLIEGIYTVDDKLLDKMPIEEFADLRKNSLLPLIYAHLTSLNQFRRLSLLQYQADMAAKA